MTRSSAKGQRSRSGGSRRVAIVAAVVVLIIIGAFAYLYYIDANTYSPAVVEDWRFYIAIYDAVSRHNITIPAGIGVTGGIWTNHTLDAFGPPGYAPLSTRDTSGTIYVQFVRPKLFVLGDFFAIWGQPYNRTCVGYGKVTPYCSTDYPPVIASGSSAGAYCPSYAVPPIDNGKSWIIILNSTVPCSTF